MQKRLAAVLVAASVLVSTFGTSALAGGVADARVWVAHGIPGVKVDVCVDGTEVRSNFAFGRRLALRNVAPGTYDIALYVANDRECRGTVAVEESVDLVSGDNKTVVAKLTGGTPTLVWFDNDMTLTDDTSVTVRHVANAPAVDVWVNGGTAPALTGLAEDQEQGPVDLPAGVYAYWASVEGEFAPVIGPNVAEFKAGKAYQVLAVGTDADTYRFILIRQNGVA